MPATRLLICYYCILLWVAVSWGGDVKGLSFAVCAMLLSGSLASAGLITYTESIVASGNLGGTSFTNQLVTLTETADSSGILFKGFGLYQLPGPATVTVAGVGTASFTDTMVVNYLQSVPDGGFGDATIPGSNVAFSLTSDASYDLSTPLAPVVGTAYGDTTDTYAIAGGDFSMNSVAQTGIFMAVATSVPEPGTLMLLGIGVAAVVATRRLNPR